MIAKAIDSLISVISPRWGLERIAARATMDQIQQFSGVKGGYDAGKLNRLTKTMNSGRIKENAIPAADIQRIRGAAWDLYRNNPYARKIVRSIIAKVIGNGISPTSAAKKPDGSSHTEFRNRAKQLWVAIQSGFDYRGKPGQGGLDTVGITKLILRSVIVGGETLFSFKPLDEDEQKRRGLPIPLSILLTDSDRLGSFTSIAGIPQPTNSDNGNVIYRGIELDNNGCRVAYHLCAYPIGSVDPLPAETQRVLARDMYHVFIEEDIDQLRGVSWFAPALMDARDVGDYRYNELRASAMAACIVLGYRRPTGSRQLGLQPSDTGDLTDADGNPVTSIQPGMFVNLGKDGALEGFNPARNGVNVEGFCQFMLRGIAASQPGIKASTITGDYRNASFSSERSADNDVWPEIEELQDWFASSCCQPIYEAVIEAGILAGYFEGTGVTAAMFNADRQNYVSATWQGPVPRSINPTDDAKSASMRVSGLLSSLQHEAAAVGADWRANLEAAAEVYEFADEIGLPRAVVDKLFGLQINETLDQPTTDSETAASDAQETADDGDQEDENDTPDVGSSDQEETKKARRLVAV